MVITRVGNEHSLTLLLIRLARPTCLLSRLKYFLETLGLCIELVVKVQKEGVWHNAKTTHFFIIMGLNMFETIFISLLVFNDMHVQFMFKNMF